MHGGSATLQEAPQSHRHDGMRTSGSLSVASHTFFQHQWDVAERLTKLGSNATPVARGDDGEPSRDLRGAFATLYATIKLVCCQKL